MLNNPVAATVAGEVRAAMGKRQVSQAKLAIALGLSQPSINRRLTGAIPFNIVELTTIAAILDVPLSTFLPSELVA